MLEGPNLYGWMDGWMDEWMDGWMDGVLKISKD